MFFDRPAIEFWAREPQFQVVDILDGHKDHIAKQQGELYLDGREVQRPLMLGQTVYVLRKAA